MSNKYLKVEGLEALQAKLKLVPEKIKKKNVHRILMTQARPLLWKARAIAYRGSSEPKKAGWTSYRKGGAPVRNLFSTLGIFKNKGLKPYYYVVLGYGSQNKRKGNLYTGIQSEGGSHYDKSGPREGRKFTLKPKDILGQVNQTDAKKVSAKQARALNKEFEKIMRQIF